MTGRERLELLALRWRRRRLAGFVSAVAAAVLLASFGFGAVLGWGTATRLWAAVVAAACAGTAGVVAARRNPVDALRVARHLDRVHPSLGESTTLLLADTSALAPLEQLQRERASAELARLEIGTLPNRPLRRALTGAAAMLLAVVALGTASLLRNAPAMVRPADGVPHVAARRTRSDQPPRIRDLDIEIRPPAYTRRPPRHSAERDFEAESGARVTWSVTADQPATALLVTADGDTVPFGGGTASLIASRPLLYRIVLLNDAGLAGSSELHRIVVLPDRPPVITVEAPPPRTLLAPRDPLRVPVRVVAADDYGLGSAELLATVTTGRGESVRFREERITFTERSSRGRSAELRTVLDLSRLGLVAGDELYFHVRVTDTRAPEPNESRSDTYFIALLDTSDIAEAEFAGTPVSRLPEYFRSQRQIIIDTERLIADQPRLATEVFRERSNGVGIDQGLLRARYGALVGDETEGGEPGETAHMHDSEENATLLAASVKTLLKAALAEMWQAELQLRTHHPEAALPYEHRALALLKEVQQAARVYVQRAGFEPPPLEPDTRRLTGEQEGVDDWREARDVTHADSRAALREALPVLAQLRDGTVPDGAARGDAQLALEAAGRDLAELAVTEPGSHLATLRVLRRLIDSLERGQGCTACADSVARGMWLALPPGTPLPRADGGPGAGAHGLARRYFDRLAAP